MARALVLFDIDGTLLRKAGPHHGQCLEDAVRRVTGRRVSMAQIATQGMLDQDILRQMMIDAGLAPKTIRAALPDIQREAQALYRRCCPDLHPRVCPGARSLLARLRRADVCVGLVTGNLTRIGWRKMERAGLRRYFQFGAFAEKAQTRAGLAALAMREAKQRGWIKRDTRVSLIGDHFNDIAAAKSNGIQAIAVATGMVTMEELRAHTPDLVLPDLRSLPLAMLL